mmetsp:Transcript_16858/g.32905  ORF Transcript_16858/g.32905 Transcript_16858/m.32905 type:complete len:101 (+) Transcript_16858:2326-2628(+)
MKQRCEHGHNTILFFTIETQLLGGLAQLVSLSRILFVGGAIFVFSPLERQHRSSERSFVRFAKLDMFSSKQGSQNSLHFPYTQLDMQEIKAYGKIPRKRR